MELKILGMEQAPEIMRLIQDAFSAAPWNDDWRDEDTLFLYVRDIIGNENSLALGLYDCGLLIGIALGRLKHWYDGVEFCIDDLCIQTSRQGKGAGSRFLGLLKRYALERQYKALSLKTDRRAPAYRFYQKNGFAESPEQAFFRFRVNGP